MFLAFLACRGLLELLLLPVVRQADSTHQPGLFRAVVADVFGTAAAIPVDIGNGLLLLLLLLVVVLCLLRVGVGGVDVLIVCCRWTVISFLS